MTLASLLPSAVGTGEYLLGSPGSTGSPQGSVSPGFNQATGQGSGWEVTVLAAPDYHTWLARIPDQVLLTVAFTKSLSSSSSVNSGASLGSGTVTLDLDDPFWASTLPNSQPASYLLDWEHLWQVWEDGVLRFEFFGTTVTEQLVDPSEQRVGTVTGNDGMQALAWAIVAPPGFPDAIVYKLDAITDGFSEIDSNGNPVLDTGLWNASSGSGVTLNPLGSAKITAGASSTTFLGSTVYDATQTLISAQVTPITQDSAGNALDGSQLSQMYIQDTGNSSNYALIGLSGTQLYWKYSGPGGTVTHIIASSSAYQTAQSGNGDYSNWQISESNGTFFFWTSPDGQNWTLQGQVEHSGWAATSVGLYFTSYYDAANTFYTSVTGLNSNVTTSSLGGPTYYSQPILSVWLSALQAAQARGTVPFITTGQFTHVTDSFGNPWSDTQSVQLQNGTDLLTLLQAHAAMVNADYMVEPGFRLVVGIPESGSITLGTDRSASVIFREGHDLMVETRTRVRNQIANLLGVINTDGRTVTSSNATSVSEYGQREGWIQAGAQVSETDITVVAAAVAEDAASEVLSYTAQILPGLPGHRIFTDFSVGDWIGLERPDFSAIDAVRVSAIAVSVAADGSETHELTLVSYIAWLQAQMAYIANKLGGNFVSAAGTTLIADNGSLTNQNTPTVFAPTLAGLGDVLSGGANGNNPLVYDPVTGQWVVAGTTNPVTGAANPMVISGPGGTVTIEGSGGAVTVGSAPTGVAGDGAASSSPAQVQTTATYTKVTDALGNVRTIVGVQSDGSYTVADFNAPAPDTPDTPTATGTLNGILVGWDGLLAAADPLGDFLWTEVHVSTTSGFTPSSSTLKATMAAAGVVPVMGLTVGTTYYVKLMARNTSGVTSAASTQSQATPTGLNASTIGQVGVLNANPYFAGGDGSTWAGFEGTFSVTGSPPAGSPLAYAGEFTISTSGVGAAAEESGQPFAVEAGAQYLVTAWVYTSTTSATVGLDWQNSSRTYLSSGTQTFTVAANTWTLVTTVQTAPANAVWAYPRLSPADGVSNTIYFTQVLCLPQVPGSLIQAGTITATQIAAATITAAQIASNTITTNQIAANTITGGNIAAATITASNIAAGAITAGLIAAGAVDASNIAAGTVFAGIVNGTEIQGAQFVAYGSTGEILVYSGTPTSGNLIGSWSANSGTDAHGNNYVAGIATYGSGISTVLTAAALQQLSGSTVLSEISADGIFVYDSSGRGSGNLINALASASGSDGAGNSYPQGLYSQQLTLNNQSADPPSFTGSSVLYSNSNGAPQLLESSGSNRVLDRSQAFYGVKTIGNTTTAAALGGVYTIAANDAVQASLYRFKVWFEGQFDSTNTANMQFTLVVDGTNQTQASTATSPFSAGQTFAGWVAFELFVEGTGSGQTCDIHMEGQFNQTGANRAGGADLTGMSIGVPFDTTVSHTLQIWGAWGQARGSGQTIHAYGAVLTKFSS